MKNSLSVTIYSAFINFCRKHPILSSIILYAAVGLTVHFGFQSWYLTALVFAYPAFRLVLVATLIVTIFLKNWKLKKLLKKMTKGLD